MPVKCQLQWALYQNSPTKASDTPTALSRILLSPCLKVGDDLMCVYDVGMFEFKDGSGYIEHVTICQLVNSLFRSLGSVELGFVSEEDLEKCEEVFVV